MCAYGNWCAKKYVLQWTSGHLAKRLFIIYLFISVLLLHCFLVKRIKLRPMDATDVADVNCGVRKRVNDNVFEE